MASYKPEEKTDEIEPIGFNSNSSPSAKNTQSGVELETSRMIENGPVNTEKRMELTRLATELHCIDCRDPHLDPTSSDFDISRWAKTVMRTAEKAGVKFRRASFSFKNLVVSGSASAAHFQPNVVSVFMAPFRMHEYVSFGKKPETTILNGFDGVVKSGETLLVLGRPGSGCSTFLKTLAGELHGLKIDEDSVVHYNGIPQEEMIREHKGEIVYNSEVDKHFPHLTVRETLEFAATVRTPRNHVVAVSREDNVKQTTAVAMAICGLTHTQNSKVGDDFVRGVSGGERKRVSIAEMILASSSIGFWDNSTRGLDSATAFEFVSALRTSADIIGTTHAVAIYQASQAIYEVFNKVIVLYEGREIYFGPTKAAKSYFEEMGWYCPRRQTTGDFLTSVTNHKERKARQGFELLVPRTAEDFQKYWKESQDYKTLLAEIQQHELEMSNHIAADKFRESRQAVQSRYLRAKSPYTISIPMQIKTCTKRAYRRLRNDKASTLTVVLGQIIMALVVGSVFYGTPDDTSSFFARGSTLFFAVLLSALIAITEINNLYQQRPIVEKHASYAFYHPFTEALAGVISDAPVKLIIATCFDLILYFLAGLRREPSQFFIFFLFTVLVRFTMSVMFRTVAASTKTISQALAMAGVLVLAIVIYTGYTIPRPYMHPWFKWLSWVNPLAYAFEALMVNEFHGREFPCSSFIPAYSNVPADNFICSVYGAVAGQTTVSGDAYVQTSFQYSYSHIWRNLGIVIAFWVFFLFAYLIATEINSSTSSAAEVLLFLGGRETKEKFSGSGYDQHDHLAAGVIRNNTQTQGVGPVWPQKSIFTWRDIVYDIHIKDEPRRLLDHVSGWVKPGTLTALMGVSGAGKTTLLDVLAQRTSVGVVSGDMLVNGKPLKSNFQRRIGYVQQQDLHLETSTVREALRFSAMLRQPKSVTQKEKYDHVEDIIEMLDMNHFSETVVGVPGEGLNVVQRKLLTIGLELAAKPALLVFLDEPTSGLDSQSSWAIVGFLRKLADSGQAILATIHQPSSILFLEFDRLLFLAKGGRTVYFGDIGPDSETLLNYFEHHGARPCSESQNPAEYILETVTAGASGKSGHNWPDIWNASDECACVKAEQEHIHQEMSSVRIGPTGDDNDDEFATPFSTQIFYTTVRVFQQYWRTPSYIWGKILLGVLSALFIGFSFFKSDDSLQGMQNVIFSIFMLTSILSSLVQQASKPNMLDICTTDFSIDYAALCTAKIRERPSKVYSWVAFILANVIVEIPYQIVLGVLVYACYYYPVFGIQSSERQILIMLFCIQVFIFASTFAHMIIVALPDTQTAGAIATLMFSLTMIFNGVFQPPQALPGFWIFMYRVSPLTYIVGGVAATGLHGRPVKCSANEISVFNPPSGLSCDVYLKPYLETAPGQLYNPAATSQCQYCPLTNSDQFLSLSAISWSSRWRNFGIVWAYIFFNVSMAMALYYVFRVKKWVGAKPAKRLSKAKAWFQLIGSYTKAIFAMWWGQQHTPV
ncbi:ABC-transporter [Lepidopterella palustris CBS 459.81]|uniref:ABC-transporter n=1 Tax=Lepidopterella palustris CBS 459.81 TaxID=1314670 RepID=A0A8E2JH65_9PEZI|nr:ABC-transporter [Lepidopterella palustris CBS 459.81]